MQVKERDEYFELVEFQEKTNKKEYVKGFI